MSEEKGRVKVTLPHTVACFTRHSIRAAVHGRASWRTNAKECEIESCNCSTAPMMMMRM